jgi:signal peptidase I
VAVTSSVGPVLSGVTCTQDRSDSAVVAAGEVLRPSAARLSVSLAVYSAEGSTLDLQGAGHTATVAAGARRFRVEAPIVRGFPPARCVVRAGTAESLEELTVTTSSMAPTVPEGSTVVVDRSAFATAAPRVGDIVVVEPPGGADCGGPAAAEAVARVVGLPGETLAASHGSVLADGRRLPEPWLPAKTAATSPYTGDFGPITVPSGDYFVLGDDRSASCDSRNWGAIPRADVLGRVVKVLPSASTTTTTEPRPQGASTPSFTT